MCPPQLLVICLTFQVLCTIVAVAGINTSKGRITGFILAGVNTCPHSGLEPPPCTVVTFQPWCVATCACG